MVQTFDWWERPADLDRSGSWRYPRTGVCTKEVELRKDMLSPTKSKDEMLDVVVLLDLFRNTLLVRKEERGAPELWLQSQ